MSVRSPRLLKYYISIEHSSLDLGCCGKYDTRNRLESCIMQEAGRGSR